MIIQKVVVRHLTCPITFFSGSHDTCLSTDIFHDEPNDDDNDDWC